MQYGKQKKISPPKEVAYIAVMCALLIGGQYVLSFAAGVEIVTLLLVCFSCTFGVRRGVICAVAFSLLRGAIVGFYPTTVILYLIYYPLLAATFGALGHIKEDTFKNYPLAFALAVNFLLLGIAAACATLYGLNFIKVSGLYKVTLHVFLWIIFLLCVCLCTAVDGLLTAKKFFKKDTDEVLKVITFTSIAAVCTIIFTLLDDVISPLFYGLGRAEALAYFYGSFTAMLPQTVCTIVSVSTMFLPLTAAMKKAARI